MLSHTHISIFPPVVSSLESWGRYSHHFFYLSFVHCFCQLGVLFLSSMTHYRSPSFSCTGNDHVEQVGFDLSAEEKEYKIRLTTLFSQSSESSDSSRKIVSLPVPYELPPPPYLAEDVPWSWDRRYTKKDVYGQIWPRQF